MSRLLDADEDGLFWVFSLGCKAILLFFAQAYYHHVIAKNNHV
jgi:hypothetical protein